MESKKGISSVLSNVLIILIVVVAVGIIGVMINGLTSNLDETITTQQLANDCAFRFANDQKAYDECMNKNPITSYAIGENCSARRSSASTYNPSSPINIKINVTFDGSSCGGVIVETVPLGWSVTSVTGLGSGTIDSSSRNIRWGPIDGPFCGGQKNVELGYTATPNSSQTGIKFFSGQFSVDGSNCPYPENYTLQFGGGAQCNLYINYSEWVNCKFSISQRANLSISGEDADPDNDSVSNFLEYALGGDPNQAISSGKPFATWTKGNDFGGELTMQYNRIRSLTDVIYTPQIARCFGSCPWNFGPLFIQPVSEIDSGDLKKTIVVRDSESWNYDNPGYMRMNVTKTSNPVKNFIIDASKIGYPAPANVFTIDISNLVDNQAILLYSSFQDIPILINMSGFNPATTTCMISVRESLYFGNALYSNTMSCKWFLDNPRQILFSSVPNPGTYYIKIETFGLTNNLVDSTLVRVYDGNNLPAKYALEFNQTNTLVTPNVNLNSLSSFSTSLWFNFKDTQFKNGVIRIIDQNWNTGAFTLHLVNNSNTAKIGGQVQVDEYNLGVISDTGSLVKNKWYFLNLVINNGQAILYLDGNELVRQTLVANPSANWNLNQPLHIGGSLTGINSPFNFKGSIDEVKIYNRSLTLAEIQQQYNSGQGIKGFSENGLMAAWNFDEGTGTYISSYHNSISGLPIYSYPEARWTSGIVPTI